MRWLGTLTLESVSRPQAALVRGSLLLRKTIGIVEVALFAANAEEMAPTAITSTLRPTRSAERRPGCRRQPSRP